MRHEDTDGKQEESRKCHAKGCHGGVSSRMAMCDGYTEFEDGTKVECVANRLVWFPSDIKHRGVSQLDTKVKSVINLNYFQL